MGTRSSLDPSQGGAGVPPLRSRPEFNANQILPEKLKPLNVGELGQIMWPCFFTFTSAAIPQNGNFTATVTINQEAAFNWRLLVVSVYEIANDGAPILVDGKDIPLSLTMTLSDPQSSRTFHSIPEPLNGLDSNFPYYLSRPILLLPNYSLQANLSYGLGQMVSLQPVITLVGYRVRLPREMQNISYMQTEAV